jgi:hypothetical protein
MSKLLGTLKLTASRKPQQVSAVVFRRTKMATRIGEQIALATAQQQGETYTPTRVRLVRDRTTGMRTAVTTHKRVKQWWFVADDGTLALSLRYGNKTLEIARGKWAVQVANTTELVTTLETLRDAVNAGELDAQIDAAAQSLRSGFVA